MLINAATSGRADHLHGLKENVIIGRKIPVGTGVNDDEEEVDEEIYINRRSRKPRVGTSCSKT